MARRKKRPPVIPDTLRDELNELAARYHAGEPHCINKLWQRAERYVKRWLLCQGVDDGDIEDQLCVILAAFCKAADTAKARIRCVPAMIYTICCRRLSNYCRDCKRAKNTHNQSDVLAEDRRERYKDALADYESHGVRKAGEWQGSSRVLDEEAERQLAFAIRESSVIAYAPPVSHGRVRRGGDFANRDGHIYRQWKTDRRDQNLVDRVSQAKKHSLRRAMKYLPDTWRVQLLCMFYSSPENAKQAKPLTFADTCRILNGKVKRTAEEHKRRSLDVLSVVVPVLFGLSRWRNLRAEATRTIEPYPLFNLKMVPSLAQATAKKKTRLDAAHKRVPAPKTQRRRQKVERPVRIQVAGRKQRPTAETVAI